MKRLVLILALTGAILAGCGTPKKTKTVDPITYPLVEYE